jgi:hypothetical protein
VIPLKILRSLMVNKQAYAHNPAGLQA